MRPSPSFRHPSSVPGLVALAALAALAWWRIGIADLSVDGQGWVELPVITRYVLVIIWRCVGDQLAMCW